MLTLTKLFSTDLDSAGRRIIKFLKFGKNDTRTAREIGPFGVDSNPHSKNMVPVYSETQTRGESVIVGYMLRDKLAAVGETRIFSTNADGQEQFFVWLKNDGKLQLGGDAGNLTRFQELETGFNNLKQAHNDLVNAFNTHVHATAGTGPPSTPTPGAGVPATPTTASIAGAKIDQIQTL